MADKAKADSLKESTGESEIEPKKPQEDSAAVELCTAGLLDRLKPTLDGFGDKLTQVGGRQMDLADKVAAERERFTKAEESKLIEMVEKTRLYHQKLTSLQKEMSSLTDRSGALTQRAVILMEAKQKEALKREHRRQKDAEREENLVAKPAKSNK